MLIRLGLVVFLSCMNLIQVIAVQAAETKELEQLFQLMQDEMDMTDVYFGLDLLDEQSVNCVPKIVSEETFRTEFVNIIQSTVGNLFDAVAPDEQSLKKLFALEIDQFVKLFDDGNGFLFCTGTQAGFMTFGSSYFFGSNSKSMTFEFGYED